MNWIRRKGRSRARDSAHGPGLGEAGHALDEDVAAGQQRDDEPLEQGALADDLAFDPVDQAEEALLRRGDLRRGPGGIVRLFVISH